MSGWIFHLVKKNDDGNDDDDDDDDDADDDDDDDDCDDASTQLLHRPTHPGTCTPRRQNAMAAISLLIRLISLSR